jgi:hypothetical protein
MLNVPAYRRSNYAGNLPPGTYTVEAWHEKLGTATQTISVGANETKAIDFIFKPKPGS